MRRTDFLLALRSRQLDESQSDGIHTVSEPGGPRPVVEYVAQMRITSATGNRGPAHQQAIVYEFLDILLRFQ